MGKIAPKVLAALQQADEEDGLTFDRETKQIKPEVEPTSKLEVSPTARPRYEPVELSQEIYD